MPPEVLENVDDDLYPVLPQFLENLQNDLQELQNHLEDDSLEDVKRIAHGIKGSAGSFGLDSFKNRARAIEDAVDGSEAIQPKLQELLEHVDAVRSELESVDDISL